MSVGGRGLASGTAVLAGYLCASSALAWATAGVGEVVAEPGPAPLDAAVGLAAAVAAWLVLTWLAAAVVLSLAATAVAGGRLERAADRWAPVVLRRLAAGVLGVGLAGVAAGCGAPPATATDAVHGSPATMAPATAGDPGRPGGADRRAGAAVLDVLDVLDRPADNLSGWTPDRPAAAPPRIPAAPVHLVTAVPGAGRTVADEVVVRRGDTLWDIAARHLGPGASAADVAAEWPRWHDANRRQIGADPDLILPGLRLTPPDRARTD